MFIKFFKSSFFIQYLVIGITGLCLWFSAFLTPPGMPVPEEPTPLYSLLFNLLHNMPLLATVVGFFLILAETYWLTRILSLHELVLKNSSLSALVFLVMMSFLPEQLTLNPINIALAFMMLILHHLLISYNKPEHLDRIFAAGFFTALASMFYLPFILWFVFVIVSFLVFRAGNWRAWMAAVIGLITPFLYLAVWYLWHDEFITRALEFPAFFSRVMVFPNPFHTDFWILSGFTLLMALWGIFLFQGGPQKTVEVRVKTNILLWTLVFTLLSFVFSRSMAIFHPALAMPALAMVITGTLIGLKKTRVAELILMIYFLSVLLNNLFLHNLVN
ncbi:MAG: DUF6427 family protein [Bacteroidetes bacterium]|nr:DUF6427 family protein [Bacteroidota bacterium]